VYMANPDQTSLAEYFSLPAQPYRSASLELDYGDPSVVGRYIPTAKSVAALDIICAALEDTSRDRAISLIAPYGSGKTSMLLFLSSLLERHYKTKTLLSRLVGRVKRISPSTSRQVKKLLAKTKGYVVVPLSGYQGDLPGLLLRGLRDALARRKLLTVWTGLASRDSSSQADVLECYRAAAKELTKKGYSGIIVVYDEFGKVLESQQGEARPADLFFLQSFAELCSRSGHQQLVLIVALHQAFAQYAQRLPGHVRNEWAKIEGRFRVVHYVEDSLQVYELIAQALRQLRSKAFRHLHNDIEKLAASYARASAQIPCFAPLKDKDDKQRMFAETFPLHPLTLYVLPRLSARVAQNERTLFHFLLGSDEDCLFQILHSKQVFGSRPEIVTPGDLYDYFSLLMARDAGIGGTYRRLIEIKAALDRVEPEDQLAISILKTIGLLSVLGDRLQAPVNLPVLAFALDASTPKGTKILENSLSALVNKKILLHRRHTGEYRIWEGSDVDLIGLLRQKKAEVESLINLAAVVGKKIRPPFVLPHRHNEDFAITRVFEGQYLVSRDLDRLVRECQDGAPPRDVDGRIYYVLADSRAEIEEARTHAAKITHPQVLIAIPEKPLNLSDAVTDLYCIEQLLQDPGFVSEDPVLRRELSELADDCLVSIRKILVKFQDPRNGETSWWHGGTVQESIKDNVSLRRYLSDCCLTIFSSTPRFNNELINRRQPSATIANARRKLLRAMLDHYGHKDFRLVGYGPDMSMFRAVYLVPGLYREQPGGTWRFVAPGEIEDENLRRVMTRIHDFFLSTQQGPCPLKSLVEELVGPPYGVREGVLPLLIGAAMRSFLLPLNLLDQGVYVKEFRAETFERMVTDAERITVQCVPLPEGVQEYLQGLQRVFSIDSAERGDTNDPLRATVEAVYRWFHQLPPCSLATYQISQEARQLRLQLLKATDPVRLIFVDTPGIIVKPSEELISQPWRVSDTYDRVLEGIKALREEMEAVASTYLNMVAVITRKVFALPEGGVEGLRQALREWVHGCVPDLKEYVDDPQCSGLLERVRSEYENDVKLSESLASLVTGKSLTHWDDTYLKQYELGLLSLHEKLVHTNTLLAKRIGGAEACATIKERIAEPGLWERLERLDDADRELLAFYLFKTIRKGLG
jgi:hypothetical protein